MKKLLSVLTLLLVASAGAEDCAAYAVIDVDLSGLDYIWVKERALPLPGNFN